MKHFTLPKDGGLIEEGLPQGVLHSRERIRTEIYPDSTQASVVIAEHLINTYNAFKASNPDRKFRLGLTTGSSPVSLYRWLWRFYTEGKISFKDIEIFSIEFLAKLQELYP